jgi:hypothetical protein
MSKIINLIAGLGGAIALNILHESLKNKGRDMPHIDELGEEALQKSLGYFGVQVEDKQDLYLSTLAGDIASNAFYYSLIGGRSSLIWPKAIALGLAAGFGAVKLPRPMGLNPAPVARNHKVSTLTVIYYLSGALVTGGILKLLKHL